MPLKVINEGIDTVTIQVALSYRSNFWKMKEKGDIQYVELGKILGIKSREIWEIIQYKFGGESRNYKESAEIQGVLNSREIKTIIIYN